MRRARLRLWQIPTLGLCLAFTAHALTVTVTTTGDSGAGSLRQAITDVNASVDSSNTIAFDISGAPVHTIVLATALPTLDKQVLVDGYSQPGYSNGAPAVALDGSGLTGYRTGLTLAAAQSSVRGLIVREFSQRAILLSAANCTVAGCHLLDSGACGVRIVNASGCTIGGTDEADRNVITGNQYAGVMIEGTAASGNTVLGNYIGVDATGLNAVSNKAYGVYVDEAPGNTIGGTAPGARNVIAANGNYDVCITWLPASNNVVQGNYLGLAADGSTPLSADGNCGVYVRAPYTTVGGTRDGAGNVIASHSYACVQIYETDAYGTVVQGNYIGLDASGMNPVTNDNHGILIYNSSGNTIGGAAPSARNVICACMMDGIMVNSAPGLGAGNTIQGNYVGIAADGLTAHPNAWSGVDRGAIHCSTASNTIGGAAAGEGNVVSGNERYGIAIWGTNAVGNVIAGNTVGLAADGTSPRGNARDGIWLYDTSQNTVGGTAPGAGNFVAHNAGSGVSVRGSNAVENAILGNSIYSNAVLGIDLADDNNVQVNDFLDTDQGANGLQNYPHLDSAAFGSTIVAGSLGSKTGTLYRLEFFASPTTNVHGCGEGRCFLGWTNLLTSTSPSTPFSVTLQVAVAKGHYVSATATDPENNTSEFSVPVRITFADADGDSIEDGWELAHSLATNVANLGDTDLDDYSDLEEFYADTHPNDSNDYPRVSDIALGSGPAVFFPSSAARLYRLGMSTEPLASNKWQFVGPQLPGNGGTFSLQTPAGADISFYGVTVTLP